MKPASAYVLAVAALGLFAMSAFLYPASVSAEDPCLPGMDRTEDTLGQCCWPGQAWNGSECVGTPDQCPAGMEPGPTGCVEVFVTCPAGQVVMPDQEHCCWPGQRWERGACAGTPSSCPEGHLPDGVTCSPIPQCTGGKELAADRLHCCWPGQAWSRSKARCIGVPRCPQGLAVAGESCRGSDAKRSPPVEVAARRAPMAKIPAGSPPMVEVAAGPFWMGCNPKVDSKCGDDEKPGREVTLSAFRIDLTEVTVEQYGACVEAGACRKPMTGGDTYNWGTEGRDLHPANGVSWDDATAYCGWLGRRLPTEAEWEKAARGPAGRRYPWGNESASCSRTVMSHGGLGCGTGTTSPVAGTPSGASPYGALGMAGNVWEWTADWYAVDAYSSQRQEDPTGPRSGSTRVRRGGSFADDASDVRSSNRSGVTPSNRMGGIGFRCAR